MIALLGLCLVICAYGLPVELPTGPVGAPLLTAPVETEAVVQGTAAQLNGGGVEGDMIFPPGVNPKSSARGVAIYGNKQWPNNIIPYDISAITDSTDRTTITNAMNALMFAVGTPIANSNQRSACVFFRPRTADDTAYFKIQYGQGCYANVGYTHPYQAVLNLQKNSGPNQEGCFYTQVIQHELMHVLGFYHEQSRPDRDNFLQVNLGNVETSMQHNFNKYVWGTSVLNQGSAYDYSSIMHYGTTAFSMNGKPTMVPRQTGVTIGEAKQLSPLDIAEVRHFYGCKA